MHNNYYSIRIINGKITIDPQFAILTRPNANQTGLIISLSEGEKLQDPLVIHHWQDAENLTVNLRHKIIAAAHSQATIVEIFAGADNVNYWVNPITEIDIATNATLSHIKIQSDGKSAQHHSQLLVQQQEFSEFASHYLTLGSAVTHSDIQIFLQEDRGRCLLNGIYLPRDQQQIAFKTIINHLAPNCASTQDYKGVLQDRSRGSFDGKIVVAIDAQHTSAAQQNKNLLLSPRAEIITKPQLEIYANDVICTHGATVGQLDDEVLFYMSSRGINFLDAQKHLILAFINDNLKLINKTEIHTQMLQLIEQQLRPITWNQ